MGSRYNSIIEPEAGIEYGILKGWCSGVFFMKLPMRANIYGYRSVFCKFAQKLNARTGYHVICAENHGDELSKKYDCEVLKEIAPRGRLDSLDCRFVGIDEGAVFGLSYLCRQINFRKILLINMPISYELDKTVSLLNGVDRRHLKFVYGDADSSYRYTPLLKRLYADVITVKGADHCFTGMSADFLDLQKLI